MKRRDYIRALIFPLVVFLAGIWLAGSGEARVPASRGAKHRAPAEPAAVPPAQVTVFDGLAVPFLLQARAAEMIDQRTGTVLYAFDEHQRMQPASLAKIVTFFLALDAISGHSIGLDTRVTISEAAWRLSLDRSVSRMFLRVGDRVAVRDLLYGLMVSSGNDAAVSLAEYLAGSSAAFAERMNLKARQLGLGESHFVNPDGLPAPGEYTTAADMVRLARLLIEAHPEALGITATREFRFGKITQPNFNALLFHDSRVNGVKTGHVQEAGYHLVASANADGLMLIAAVLGAPSPFKRWSETDKLLDWGFRSFSGVRPDWHKAVPAAVRVYGGAQAEVAVALEREPYALVLKGQENKVALALALPRRYLVAPVSPGVPVGELAVMVGGKPQSTIALRTAGAVQPGNFFKRVFDRLLLMF